MEGHIHSTESFGTVDGPGIRFVVFFQGCPMRCLYCHNPDTWTVGGGDQNLRSVESLLKEYDGIKEFLHDGGITATGGEPLLQMPFLTELFEAAKKKGIHTCLDSCGITFRQERRAEFDRLMAATDLVMLDIKHIDDAEHQKLTGQSNKHILEFAEYLKEKNVPVWIRHVVVPTITLNDEYLYRLGYFIGGLDNLKALDVLPYHTMGEVKYQNLGIDYPLKGIPAATKKEAEHAKEVIFHGMKARIRDDIEAKKA
ncbi:pyruvate formate-lyase-activating protein [uncultured Ruminococcus sp.]|jgi:pyruvate formate lyase activating enzyme|uniref:pyruvate formate-lyase-activating protein n=1 Tax=uncultured Ruminococcus sp. TaxID=165186 RepID=UPI0026360E36|nr:pyruvate formate-lyase-activating protein [uncultured Ruminococcus sp.]